MTAMIVHSTEPFNAEPEPAPLRAQFLTPPDLFYVRSHGAVPRLHARDFRLHVSGRVATPCDYSLADLQTRFPHRRVTAAMQCAGNRRADLLAVRPVSGDPWRIGAIGNAEWEGVALADILDAAAAATGDHLHVAFTACDRVETDGSGAVFAVSIPLAKARTPDVLLAWAMNGASLTPAHGYPLRVVVPGYAGIRSAKWVCGIELRDSPADGPMQRQEYHLYPADVTPETADPSCALSIGEMPLNAAICEPAAGAILAAGPVSLRGYAVCGARGISRVEVSADGGHTWAQATLEPAPSCWSWILWHAELHLPPGRHELAVRAWDRAGQTQPGPAEQVWNFKGYLCNAWHRVAVDVQPS